MKETRAAHGTVSRVKAGELKPGDVLVPDHNIQRVPQSKGVKAHSFDAGANWDAGTITAVDVPEGTASWDTVTVTFNDLNGKEHIKVFSRGQNILVER